MNIFVVGLLQLLNHKLCLQSETLVLFFSLIAFVGNSDGLLARGEGRFGNLNEFGLSLQLFDRYVNGSGVFRSSDALSDHV